MKHLTVDEIIDFVSLSQLNQEAINLCSYVNGHIRECEKCLELVRSFQIVHDEFSRVNMGRDFRKYIPSDILHRVEKNEADRSSIDDELEAYR